MLNVKHSSFRKGMDQEFLEEKYKELLNTYMSCRREGVIIRKVDRHERELEEKLERKELIIKKYMRKEKMMNRGLEDQRKVSC